MIMKASGRQVEGEVWKVMVPKIGNESGRLTGCLDANLGWEIYIRDSVLFVAAVAHG